MSRSNVFILMLVSSTAVSACDPSSPAGSLPDAIECMEDSDCRDDGLFCNGHPKCEEQTFETDRGPWRIASCDARQPPPCAARLCDESTDHCACDDDADSDGHMAIGCGGDDCDDEEPLRFPGNTEVCDRGDLDEDCNPATFGFRDRDADGSPDAACCNGTLCGDDCDDDRGDVHYTASEACDGRDNDCDGAVDEGVRGTTYEDADGDGWGVGEPSEECFDLAFRTSQQGDCDDERSQLHPGAFRCLGSAGSEIEMCDDNGRWVDDECPGGGLCVPQPDGSGVCFPGDDFPQCSDGIDNDGDMLADFRDPECASPLDNTEGPRACENGSDDDDDDLADFPNDPGCASAEDNSETDPATLPACANGVDDDGDGTADYVGGSGDPGCVSASDDSEREASGPTCDNGLNDDGDLLTDYPDDKNSCSSAADDGEQVPACSNGNDDDLDGLIDFGDDIGCDSALDADEHGPNYLCDNGLDDDMDGATDYPGDVGCVAPMDTSETP